ncbi:MAG: chromosomal replication initiator protein DnaA [Deltaproteobacteria bacterium]|nr:chromosomal replication initiator protein DnaA [Deltaproteobacteria bacterium]
MEKVWHEVLSNMEKVLTPHTFTTWIQPLTFLDANGNVLYLEAPNNFFREMVRENYLSMIEEAVSAILQTKVVVEIRISPKARHETPSLPVEPSPAKEPVFLQDNRTNPDFCSNLNPKYTFETFVCGAGNQFAHAAAQAVANKPATNYNPLFIYGGVGLGKTHLLTAIGNHILSVNSAARICLYTSEKFMNEMINCIRYKKMEEFRNKFRSMDVLLIDDIQFMAGKEATQEEFFHTFNSLHESHKQIVVTSDKFPKDMAGLEQRLRSRFEWGLIADIQPPDMETKVAILKKKSEVDAISLPDDVALFLASSSTSNVRELEGMLIRLGAFASLTGNEISLSMAKEVLKDIIVEKNREVSVEMIQKFVSEYFSIKVSDLKSDKRLKTVVIPRQIAIFLCRDLTKSSYPEIGEKFGGKDHSTIIHSFKKISKLVSSDSDFKNTVETIRRGLLE